MEPNLFDKGREDILKILTLCDIIYGSLLNMPL
jgi:hypothetical protein